MSPFVFKVYRDDEGRWRWRAQSANGRILADSGQGYDSPSAARKAVERIKVKALSAPVEEI